MTTDSLVIDIEKKLHVIASRSFEHSIYMVPDHLRKENVKAYEPQMISIGPYHNGKDHLKAMEEHKTLFLQMFLDRSNKRVADLVKKFRTLEESARRCYAINSVNLNVDKFVEIMLFDGCFIVEFFCKFHVDEDDPIFETAQMISRLVMDLLLVENQLPFFVLKELFSMTNYKFNDMIEEILDFFKIFLPGEEYDRRPVFYSLEEIKQIKHLLALVHDSWKPYHGLRENYEIIMPLCAMELREAGIEFKKKKFGNLFDISFDNGIIRIPTLKINGHTERIMRNLIAFEQLNPIGSPKYVSGYMMFMDGLVNSEKDVEIFCGDNIFENWVEDKKAVATLFNKITVGVYCEMDHYTDIQREVNLHCRKIGTKWKGKWKVWMANLSDNYFCSPWALMSVLAAITLLLLTCAQTVYSVLSYSKF